MTTARPRRFLLAAAAVLAALCAARAQDAAPPFREFPIGDPVAKNAMKIVAVWLPPVKMDHMEAPTGKDVIHLECDVHGARNNPNGFALGEWIPYLTVSYRIEPLGGAGGAAGEPITGRFHPMVAKDGPHYGASIRMPGKGRYKLTYELRPPSENGFGRHTDPVTGVEPWWKPFEVTWEWDFPGSP